MHTEPLPEKAREEYAQHAHHHSHNQCNRSERSLIHCEHGNITFFADRTTPETGGHPALPIRKDERDRQTARNARPNIDRINIPHGATAQHTKRRQKRVYRTNL